MSQKTHPQRPFVYLCTGMSLDGKISTYQRLCSPVTTDDNRDFLFDHRIPCDAVMVGGRTIIFDDPSLTVKTTKRQKQRLALGKTKEPIKVAVVSDISGLKINGDFLHKGEGQKIIFTTKRSSLKKIEKVRRFAQIFIFGAKRVDLKKALSKLSDLGIKSLMVEGGGELIASLFKDNLIDEINLKIGDLILGGRTAPTLCDGDGFTALTSKQVQLISLKRHQNYLTLKYKVIKNNLCSH